MLVYNSDILIFTWFNDLLIKMLINQQVEKSHRRIFFFFFIYRFVNFGCNPCHFLCHYVSHNSSDIP